MKKSDARVAQPSEDAKHFEWVDHTACRSHLDEAFPLSLNEEEKAR